MEVPEHTWNMSVSLSCVYSTMTEWLRDSVYEMLCWPRLLSAWWEERSHLPGYVAMRSVSLGTRTGTQGQGPLLGKEGLTLGRRCTVQLALDTGHLILSQSHDMVILPMLQLRKPQLREKRLA